MTQPTVNESIQSVNIRPEVTILSVLRHLNYKPWFAVAEFVDNALQSYLINLESLQDVDGPDYRLRVSIDFEPNYGGRLAIRDNAAGIHAQDYLRAFRAAEVPADTSGLSEFGIGMKSAACWFGKKWKVRSCALGETVERTVKFDIDKIVEKSTELLSVESRPAGSEAHFTEVVIDSLSQKPQGRTLGKIKDHLASIYRIFLRDANLDLIFDGVHLIFEEPPILTAPFYKDEGAEQVYWRKEIDIDLGLGTRIHGFAALRETGSTTGGAGFALFRRNRLIDGSLDDSYRPEQIFGRSNSFTFQRLFGELHLEGFEVSHTKDGFKWAEYEDIFIELLKAELDSKPVPLITQAEGYRSRPKSINILPAANAATERTAVVLEHNIPRIIEQQVATRPVSTPPPTSMPLAQATTRREFSVRAKGVDWIVAIELANDPSIGEWLYISDHPAPEARGTGSRRLSIRLSLAHPFMVRFAGSDASTIEPLLRVAVALGLAETTARDSGVKMAGTIRHNVNEILRDALSKP